MANIAKLKKRALDFEQKKQFDRALETYMQILSQLDEHVSEADMALYNRVGDLLHRKGDIAAAVDHYEKAVDLYTESGFFNNAIALCNKVLRNAPGRTSVYYKLGRISAKKGFINDAKQNFLEYADRMQQQGDLEEAFRALKEFADLCPDQDDIRLMLADQLVRKDRKGEAIEQLQRLYEKLQAEGRGTEARATLDRMRVIDPTVQPRAGTSAPTPRSSELVFLDVDYDDAPAKGPSAGAPSREDRSRRVPPPAAPEPSSPIDSLTVNDEPAEPELPAELSFDSSDPADDIELPLLGAESLLSSDDAPDEGTTAIDSDDASRADDTSENQGVEQIDGLITGFDSSFPSADATGGLDDPDPAPLQFDSPLRDIESLAPAEDADASSASAAFDADSFNIVPSEVTLGDLPTITLSSDDAASLADDLPPIATGDDVLHASDDSAASLLGALDEVDADLDLPPIARGGHSERTTDLLADDTPASWLELPEQPPIAAPTPARPERASDRLRQALRAAPNQWHLHRRLAEALFEEGDRVGGLRELETAMLGLESEQDLNGARSMAEEIIRVEPNSVRHHQKRVEYAVRANDRPRLVDAYVDLAEALFRAGELEKSRVVYARVLELAPHDERVRSALVAIGRESGAPEREAPEHEATERAAMDREAMTHESITREAMTHEPPKGGPPSPRPPALSQPRAPRRPTPAPAPTVRRRPTPTPTPRAAPAIAASNGDEPFVNLGEWLRDEEAPKSTRMVVDVKEPAHEDQVDFGEMLAMFKQGVEANVDEGDYEAHYDLGVAYKEMGLLDEAISEFQKALRGPEHRVRSYEALGQCFVEKEQYQIAVTILSRAIGDTEYTDDILIGVLYLLGLASEKMEHWEDAQRFYERVCALDIQFRDVRDRLTAVERRAS
ncbi:MAG TPA: tetratricopeptide repeat protein [Gemmatimonadaceae bacterium]